MTEAIDAARRIVEQHGNPVNFDLFCKDASTIAHALLSLSSENEALRKALLGEPTPEMIAAGGRALKEYIESLSPEERAKLKPRTARNGDNAGYNIKPQIKAAVRWKAMARAALKGANNV